MPSVEVQAKFESAGDPWMFTTAVATADKDWSSRGSDFNDQVIANVLPSLGSDTVYLGCQWGDPYERDTPGEFVPAPADSAGGGGLSLPAEVAATITKQTPTYGRGKQGRWFLSGIPQEGYSGGELEATYRETLQTAMTAFMAGLAGAAIVVLVARVDRATSPPTLIGTDIVSRLTVQVNIRGQRRRQHLRSISGRGGGGGG